MTEKELVKSLRWGDLSALEELLDRYTPYVSSVISRILRGRHADVEELTADVFLAAWDNRDKLRPGQGAGPQRDGPDRQRGAGPAGQTPAGAVRPALLLRPDGAGGGAGHGAEPVHRQDLAAPGAGDAEN